MNDIQRGVIQHKRRAAQLCDFGGLRFGTITPTDIDVALDFFHGRAFAYGEMKFGDAPLKQGQRDHLAYLCRAIACAGYPCLVFVARHDVPDHLPIPVHTCLVTEYRVNSSGWRAPEEDQTVLDILHWFLGRADVQRAKTQPITTLIFRCPEGHHWTLRAQSPLTDALHEIDCPQCGSDARCLTRMTA